MDKIKGEQIKREDIKVSHDIVFATEGHDAPGRGKHLIARVFVMNEVKMRYIVSDCKVEKVAGYVAEPIIFETGSLDEAIKVYNKLSYTA